MSRNKEGLEKAISEISALKEEFYSDVRILGSADTLNLSLEKAGRVSDFFELAELMAQDALKREESCGGHFREESQTTEGEAVRDDKNFTFVSVWEYKGEPSKAKLIKEKLNFEEIEVKTRSYK